MAITTLDGALAGMQPTLAFGKVGITMAAVAGQRAYTLWYAAGIPGAATANSAGLNGAAVVGRSDANPGLYRENPTGGNFAYVARFGVTPSASGALWLIDRLWHNSGLSVTSTTAQAITPVSLPARSRDGTVNGLGVFAAVEWSATGGAGTPTVTLTYTNQSGTTGRSATLTGVASPPVGTFEVFNLQGSDTGVRAPTSFIQSATRTSGTMHLVLFRVLAQVETTVAGIPASVDVLTGGMSRVYDDSCLQLVWWPSGTAATGINGVYVETQG